MAHLSLEKQLEALLKHKGILGLKLESGKTVEDALKAQAKLLISILKEEINRLVYSRFESGWYDRTGDLLNSVNESVVIDPATNTITVNFIDDLAWHESAITKYRDSSYNRKIFVPMAVNEGFHTLDTSGEYWTKSKNWYDGAHFLESAVAKFEQEKLPWVSIKLEKPDKWW